MAVFGLLSKVFILAFVIIRPYEAAALASDNSSLDPTPGHVGIGPTVSICSDTTVTHGYTCEEYDVVTGDGYILRLQRFPKGRTEGGYGRKKQPVFLQHGVLVDGMYWFLNNGADQCLPLILADNGYDVWIGNSRGTRFSRRHMSLDPNGPEFWDWSWDEMVLYDLPASVDFVVNYTGQKVQYVGHSLGTTIALASFSQGMLVDKVKSVVLLSPVAYLNHITTAIGRAASEVHVDEFALLLGLAEIDLAIEPIRTLLKVFCGSSGIDCFDLYALYTGKNCCLNSSTIELFLNNEPQPTSAKNLAHLAQGVRNGNFSKYDYGSAKSNLEHYGQATVPVYNLANIPQDLPLFLCYGGVDALADHRDVENLLDTLQLHAVQRLYIKDYAHEDFVNAVNAKDLVYTQVIAFFESQQESAYMYNNSEGMY